VKRLLNIAFKLLVSCGLILYLASKADLGELRQIVAQTTPWLFAAAVLLFVVSNTLGSAQWYLLLRAQKLAVSFRQALVFYFVGVFFNNVLLGNIGGDAMRIYDIRRLTGQSSSGIAATVMDRFIGLFSTCTLALLAYPLIASRISAGGPQFAWVVSVLIPVWAGLVAILAMGLSQRIGSLLEKLASRFLPALIADLLARLRRSIGVYRHQLRLLLTAWLLSLGVQLCRILVYWTAGLALGLEVGLIYFICFQPVAAILAALPISIGGLGVREGTLVGLFGSIGVPRDLSLAMSLLGYVAGILASLLGGIAFVIRRVEPNPAPSTEGE
jgi:glycosyltransferase 2 family protein